MSIDEILFDTEEKMLKTEDHVVHEFSGVRTGKASPSLIENIMVEAYESHMRLKELATISVPEPRMLVVQPFDVSNVKAVEKAIQSSGLGLNPSTQGRFIRVVLPDLSTERRHEFVKIVKRMSEEGRVAIRSERRAALERFKKLKGTAGVSEDDLEGAEISAQKLTDQFIKRIDDHLALKEREILTV